MPTLGVITSSTIPQLLDSDRRVFDLVQQTSDWSYEIIQWDNIEYDLQKLDAFIFRSCWDYHINIKDFYQFLDRLEVLHKPIFNPLDEIRKNTHKFYLAELQLKGVQIIPTIFLRAGEQSRLSHIMEDNHWDQVVVKPAISAASHLTWLALFSEIRNREEKFQKLLSERDLLVQPFIPEIQGTGEYSTIFFADGTHYSVRKTPIDGDFRVQKEFGGIYEPVELNQKQIKTMQEIWATVSKDVLFGRVDGIFEEGEFFMMELELIEPDLYLDIYPKHEAVFAKNILEFLSRN